MYIKLTISTRLRARVKKESHWKYLTKWRTLVKSDLFLIYTCWIKYAEKCVLLWLSLWDSKLVFFFFINSEKYHHHHHPESYIRKCKPKYLPYKTSLTYCVCFLVFVCMFVCFLLTEPLSHPGLLDSG